MTSTGYDFLRAVAQNSKYTAMLGIILSICSQNKTQQLVNNLPRNVDYQKVVR
jgi:hypothetical protein